MRTTRGCSGSELRNKTAYYGTVFSLPSAMKLIFNSVIFGRFCFIRHKIAATSLVLAFSRIFAFDFCMPLGTCSVDCLPMQFHIGFVSVGQYTQPAYRIWLSTPTPSVLSIQDLRSRRFQKLRQCTFGNRIIKFVYKLNPERLFKTFETRHTVFHFLLYTVHLDHLLVAFID